MDCIEPVSKGISQIDAFFRRSIEVAQARGDMNKELDPAETAKTLIALTVGIRALGRGVFDQTALRVVADQAKRS